MLLDTKVAYSGMLAYAAKVAALTGVFSVMVGGVGAEMALKVKIPPLLKLKVPICGVPDVVKV